MTEPRSSPRLGQSFAWYLIVGGAKTLGSYAIYALLVLAGLHPQVALVSAHVVVTVLGYRGHARLAFGVHDHSGFWRYAVITSVVYGVNAGLLALGTRYAINPLVSQALCQLITIPLGFLVLRGWLRPSPVATSAVSG